MISLCRSVPVALLGATAVAVCLQASAAVQLTALDRSRLASIKRITDAKSEGTQWHKLLTYFRTGPSTKVRYESARALSRVCDLELKAALVKIASDAKERPGTRTYSIIALRGSVRHMTDDDIESVLTSDEGMRAVFVDTLTQLAAEADLSLEQVERIIERYDKGPANVRGNRNVGIVKFAGRHLANHRGIGLDAEVRPVLVRFLVRCARSAGAKPSDLRPSIGHMMAENEIPGAVEVLVGALKDDLARQKRRGQPYRAGYAVGLLRQASGDSMVTDEEKRAPEGPDGSKIAGRWLAWWDKNRKNPQYRLPPAEASVAAEPKKLQDGHSTVPPSTR